MRDLSLPVLGLFVFAGLVILFAIALGNKQGIKDGTRLPNGATNVIVVGSDWYEFTYKGKRILYHHTGIADNAVESMTVIGSAND